MTEEMECLHNFNDGICKTCGAVISIYNAQNPLRQKAIKILEAIAKKFGNGNMFDARGGNIEPDGTWYEYEDMVTEILAK